MSTTLVLLSGGMDSTVALADALANGDTVHTLSVNYGQRHVREIDAARAVAIYYGVPHDILDLSSFGALVNSSLTSPDMPVPEGAYDAPSMSATVVPNRNATFLMAAVGIAQSRGADQVVTAVHAGDHPVYPDCRPEFIDAANHTAQAATEGQVTIRAPFVEMSKAAICRYGTRLEAPLHLTWSCYQGRDLHCGRCGTCTERAEAFHLADVPDPTEYADPTFWRIALGAR